MAADFKEVERAFLAVVAARSNRDVRAPAGDEDLARACNGNAELAAEVRSLLRHLDAVGDGDANGAPVATAEPAPNAAAATRFLDPAELHADRDAARAADRHGMLDDWGASGIGQRVGDFTLIGERGAGGMGVVFVAEQEKPRRTVALKLVRRQAATPALVRRFDREAQLLARLNHPGVAQVYAAGVADLPTATGAVVRVPYIAMELVDGPNLLEYVRAWPPDPALVLRLAAQVCDAVQHAHLRGVIHRDLKPANILVSTGADGPQVKVLDFGVARLAEEDPATNSDAATALTGHGQVLGTLAYMSPEQVRSDRDVDARSDVYALGVIVHQLLAGELPIDVRDCPLPEAARRIVEREPVPLSSLDRAFRGDVETIVATALQKDPARRYQSPAELARDIRHHLAGEPIEARRASLIYVLARRGARYRTIALATAALLVVVAAAAGYARKQQKASQVAERAALTAGFKARAAQSAAERAAALLAAELSASRIDQGRLLGAAGDLAGAERLLWDEHFYQPDRRAARWALGQLYSRSGCLRTVAAHRGECRALSLSADGRRLATGGDDPLVRVWTVPEAEKVIELDTGLAAVRALAFSPDGRHLVVAGAGGAVLLDLANATAQRLAAAGAGAHGADFAANGLAVAVGCDDGAVRLFDPSDGLPLATLPPDARSAAPALRGVRFAPACDHLAAAYADGTVRLCRIELSRGAAIVTPGPPVAGRPGTFGYGVDFSPDGALLASGSSDRTLTLWRVADGAPVATWATKNGSARSAAFSPDGRRAAVPGFWRTRLFDVATGAPATPPALPALGDGGGHAAAFTPDGRLLIATGPGGTFRLWDLSADPTTVLPSTPSPVRDLAAARAGDDCLVASAQHDGEIRVRAAHLSRVGARRGNADAWRVVMRRNVGGRAQSVAITPDGAWVIVGCADGRAVTLDARDGHSVQDLPAHTAGVNVVRLAPDGQTLITGGSDDVARLWRRRADGAGWEPVAVLPCGGNVIGAGVHPTGRSVATSARPGKLQLWELPTGRPLGEATTHEMPWRLAYSPDGRRIAAGSWDRTVQLWDVSPDARPPARLAATLHGHAQLVMNQAFDPSGELLATVSNDGSLRIWDLAGLDPAEPGAPPQAERRRGLISLDAGAGDTLSVAFLPTGPGGGSCVAVGYLDGSVRVWDLGYFDRHFDGQVAYQRALRDGTAPWPSGGPE